MRKTRRTRSYIKYLCCIMAVTIGLLQPYAALAVEEAQSPAEDTQEPMQDVQDTISENGSDTDQMQYITGFEALAEDDAYFPCMYKPGLEELRSVFPGTIWIWTEGAKAPVEVEVTWECNEDYDTTQLATYIFYPKWDDTLYRVADAAAASVVIPSITVEVPLSNGAISDLDGAKSALQGILGKKAVLALVYLCNQYEVKDIPSCDGGTICTVTSGQSVQITDVEPDEYGSVWYKVRLYRNAKEYSGYVEKKYLATSDEDFINWEDTYLDVSSVFMMMGDSAGYSDVDQFPASYQNALYALKDKHPNWIFARMDTGVDWNTAIASEMGDKSLIHSSLAGSWQNGVYGQGWSYASEGILKYYMDPRNFLNESSIFQFEQLTYNSSYHTTTAVQEVIKNSFMSSVIPGDSKTYAQAFTEIGQRLNISPFHLASRVVQEQGTKGTSPIISGGYSGYEGYYNYFNVGAAGKTDFEVIVSGLKKAVEMGWNTRYKSLEGGAALIGERYIMMGQDTLYLQKFNVSGGKYPNFTHQYMQNIQAPSSEASNVQRAYSNAGALDNSFVFKIPVYNNMPSAACSQPEKKDVLTLNKTSIGSLAVDKKDTLIPYINGSKVDYVNDMTFTSSNTSVAVVDSQGKITAVSPGTATISCTRSGANTASCTVTVVKGTPNVLTPDYRTCTYRDGLKLSDVLLPDGWTWENADTKIAVGTASYPAVFTPQDTTRYNTVTKQISVTVTKAIPTQVVPDEIEAHPGMTLGEIMLPSGFTWESDTSIVLQEAGTYTFYASYNPDEQNYETVNHIRITVQVLAETQGPGQGGTSDGNGSGSINGGSSGNGGNSGSGGNGNGGGSLGDGTGGDNVPDGSNPDSTTSSDSTTSGGSSSNPTTSTDSTTSGGSSSNPTTSTDSTTSGGSSGNPTTSTNTTTGGNASTGNNANGKPAGGAPMLTLPNNSTQATPPAVNTPVNNVQTGSTQNNSTSTGATQTGTTQNNSTSTGNTQTGAAQTSSSSTGNTQADNTQSNTAANGNGTGNNAFDGSALPDGNESSGNIAAEEDYSRPSVTVQMEDTTILTSEKLQMAKEQNLDLILDMGDYVSWSINADTIDSSVMSDVDMGVTLQTENVPTELIAEILDGNKYLEFTTTYDGAGGFSPFLNIALNPENSGRYANLFCYDPGEETLEFVSASVIDADGTASFLINHAASYIIIVSDSVMSAAESFDDVESGIGMPWKIVAGILGGVGLLLAAYGIFSYRKKSRVGEDEDEDNDEDDEDGEDDEEIEDDDEEMEEDDEEIEEYTMPAETVQRKKKTEKKKPVKINAAPKVEEAVLDAAVVQELPGEAGEEESDWIEDDEWNEPDVPIARQSARQSDEVKEYPLEEEHRAEDDWIEDDEWETANDWVDDEEWERMNGHK